MKLLSALFEVTAYSAVLFAAVMGFKLAFKSRLSPALHFALWFLVIARLCIPVTVESDFHFFAASKPGGEAELQAPVPEAPEERTTAFTGGEAFSDAPSVEAPAPAPAAAAIPAAAPKRKPVSSWADALTALLLHARMLRRANMTEEERDNSLAHIESQCAWLERLVQTLLRLITLERDIERRPCEVDELFDRVRQNTQKSLADRGVTLNVQSNGETLDCNADLVQSMLINLVDNAAKAYNADAADKRVLLTFSNNTIQVKDFGRGIPKEAMERIFEPFYMVDKSRSKKAGGSGLGLALVKRIANAHDAELIIESNIEKGTTVWVRF